jgi:hypothetical protein
MKKLVSLVFVLSLLVLGLRTGSVFADSGGIKVDDDNVCADTDRETNVLGNSVPAYVWLNAAAGGG